MICSSAQHELKLSRFMARLCKQELLVLDEFGFIPFSRDGANLLFQLCSALYERSAIIITSNLKFGDWNCVMGEEHLTAALLDRLTHRAHILEFLGESFRFRQRLRQSEQRGEEGTKRNTMNDSPPAQNNELFCAGGECPSHAHRI